MNGWVKIAAVVVSAFLALLVTGVALTYNQGSTNHGNLHGHEKEPGHPVAMHKISEIKEDVVEIKADVKELLRRSQ